MMDTVNPEKILYDLHALWDQLGRDKKSAGGVLRACSMTLIVVAEDEADCEQVRRTTGILMHDHPSRAIVLRAKECADVEARVFAECWMPTGGSHQICAEGIEISGGEDRWSEVARVLAPLLVPDLPVILWYRGNRAFSSSRAFEPLYALAEKIIVDSEAAPEPDAALVWLRQMTKRHRRVADLAWTRLTGWREAIANASDDGLLPISAVDRVCIMHGGSKPPSCALYFSSWIKRAIPSARVAIEAVPGERDLQAITFSGAGSEIAVRRAENSLEVRSGTRRFRSLLPAASDDALMREELSILEADPIFDSVVGG